jgi:hypothetical protein
MERGCLLRGAVLSPRDDQGCRQGPGALLLRGQAAEKAVHARQVHCDTTSLPFRCVSSEQMAFDALPLIV